MKRCLIHFDILGYINKPREIAKKLKVDENKIREHISSLVEKEIKNIEKEGFKVDIRSDDYTVIVDNIQTAFKIICRISNIKTLFEEDIKLAIALDTKEIKDLEKYDKIKSIREVVESLKLCGDITEKYKEYYKEKHGKSIKDTFLLLTEDAYKNLEPLDKKHCKRIRYDGKTFYTTDIERIRQRCKVFEFLKKIKREESKLYDRIDELYVEPIEYNEIKEALEKDRIVFIVGTPEYGKTYTSVRLLWEYFSKGYEPIWKRGDEEALRLEVRDVLEDIESVLKPRRIIYFEDPFGKIKYEKRESLERDIDTIIETVKKVDDVYVIITSREEVFKEFEKECYTDIPEELVERINIKKPSYDTERRKKILLKWAENVGCKWLENEDLKREVLEFLEEDYLPTPLSIRDFVMATRDITTFEKLRNEIKNRSEKTAKTFAKEIENMSKDKVIFLSFLFISDDFTVDFIRKMYEEMVKELNISDAWDFDKVFNWFRDDKIEVFLDSFVRFSHPSYKEALKHILVDKGGSFTEINKRIFSKLLIKLAKKEEATSNVAWVVAKNYDRLPDDARSLLFKLVEKEIAALGVAWGIAENFNILPDNVRNLLFKLAEKEETARYVAKAVAVNFSKLPENVRNDLLIILAEKEEAAPNVAWVVAKNFNRLPENVRNLLFKLAKKERTALSVALAVAFYFSRLPDDVKSLLFELAEREETARHVAWAVVKNFDKLPKNVRNDLLIILAEREKADLMLQER